MKWIRWTLAVAALILIGWVSYILYLANAFRTLEPVAVAGCRQVEGVVGAEDITIAPEGRWAYLSSSDRRALLAGKDPGPGAIYRYDLESDHPRPQKMELSPAMPFQPHGISLFVAPDGVQTLFVINHAGGQHRIDIFRIEGDRLIHRRTLTDPALISPNDIAAISPNQAYVTNDHGFGNRRLQKMEDYLRLPLASVVYIDEKGASVVADHLHYANGIQLSPRGDRVYVAGTTEPALRVYDRDPGTQQLTLDHTIALEAGPDNIELDRNGHLWVGAHPKLLAFTAHARDPKALSPSAVLEIDPQAPEGERVTTRYLEEGQRMSGSSVGAVRGHRLLIGSVFEPLFLDCRLREAP
ncbi:SMP-30/gluconolactonase/LRE family protein [Marinobacteraceae bacterium S3BR75-40.1]